MNITRVSQLSGITHTRDIAITAAELKNWLEGMKIQEAMPHLSNSDREFILSGITDEEWEDAFRTEEIERYLG